MKIEDVTREYILTRIDDLLGSKVHCGDVDYYKVQGNKIIIEGCLDVKTTSLLALYLRKLEKLEAEALKVLVEKSREDIKHGRTKPMRSFVEELKEKYK